MKYVQTSIYEHEIHVQKHTCIPKKKIYKLEKHDFHGQINGVQVKNINQKWRYVSVCGNFKDNCVKYTYGIQKTC